MIIDAITEWSYLSYVPFFLMDPDQSASHPLFMNRISGVFPVSRSAIEVNARLQLYHVPVIKNLAHTPAIVLARALGSLSIYIIIGD